MNLQTSHKNVGKIFQRSIPDCLRRTDEVAVTKQLVSMFCVHRRLSRCYFYCVFMVFLDFKRKNIYEQINFFEQVVQFCISRRREIQTSKNVEFQRNFSPLKKQHSNSSLELRKGKCSRQLNFSNEFYLNEDGTFCLLYIDKPLHMQI